MAVKQITPKTGLAVGSSGDSSKIAADVSMGNGNNGISLDALSLYNNLTNWRKNQAAGNTSPSTGSLKIAASGVTPTTSNTYQSAGKPVTVTSGTGSLKVAASDSKTGNYVDDYLRVDPKTGKGNNILASSNTKAYEALAKKGGLTGAIAEQYLNKVNPITLSPQTQALSDAAATQAYNTAVANGTIKNGNPNGVTSSNPLLGLIGLIGNGVDAAKNGLTDLINNTTPSDSPERQAFLEELGDPSSWSSLMPSARAKDPAAKVPGSMVDDGSGSSENGGTNPGAVGGGGSGGGSGGGGSGGGGSGSYASMLSQLAGGTGLGGLGGGVAAPYVPVAQAAGANSPEAAAAYAQLLQNAGYDLSKPIPDIALPNRIALPEEIDLPEYFDFERMYNNLPEVNVGRINHVDTHPEEEMLGQITDLQSQQAILNADNTVNNGITELQRVMQNAQNQYQTQRDQIAMDERRALDNQALYNEARGDRGGIGAEQYNTIQNTAATNRLTVQKEQTQLATDTARQIADLRAQGEFEKANQLLSISQKYLSELMDLYQWAKETNLGVDEFNLQVEQWEENFKLSLVGAELDAEAFNLNVANAKIDQANNRFNAAFNQENSLFDARLNAAKLQNDEALARLNAQLNAANATGTFANGVPTYAATQDAIANQLKERSMLADIGTALIKAGIQPSEQILAAMGMGGTATGVAGGALAGTPFGNMDAESILRAAGIGNAGLAGLSALGITPEQAVAEAFGLSTTGLPSLDTSSLGVGNTTPVSSTGVATQAVGSTVNPATQAVGSTVNPANYATPEDFLKANGWETPGINSLKKYNPDLAKYILETYGTDYYINRPAVSSTPMATVPSGGEQIYNQLASVYPNSQNEIAAYTDVANAYTNAANAYTDAADNIARQLRDVVGNNYSTAAAQQLENYYAPSRPSSSLPSAYSYLDYADTQPTASGYYNDPDALAYAALGVEPETVLRAAGIGNDGFAGLAALGISPGQLVVNAFGL